MILVGAKDIEKSFVDKNILHDVTFNISDKDKIGLVGINGAGKTTLFNILTGKLPYDSGDLFIKNNIKIGYLEQHSSFDPSNTLYEECLSVFKDVLTLEAGLRKMEVEMETSQNLEDLLNKYHKDLEKFEKMGGYQYDSEIKGVLKGFGFSEDDYDKNVNQFSGGQKSRIMLAKLILEKNDLLFLDEPTNHLDIEAIEFLESFLKNYRGAFLVISHDRFFLDNVVSRIFHMEQGTLKAYETDYTGFIKQRKIYMDIQKKAYENQQKEYKRQLEIVEKYTNTDNAKKNKQGQSRKKLLEKMKLMDKPEYDDGTFSISFKLNVESGKDVLKVENLSKSFDGKKIFENISFDAYSSEKAGIIGANGVGKSTLFNIITGKISPDEGRVRLGSNVRIAYFDQEQKNLNPSNTIIDEIWDTYPRLTHFEVRSALAKLNFYGDDIFNLIEDLSGGEKARVSLLKIMLSDSNFLLMDEPTNHLDIDSKEALEDALLEYPGTVLVISHDRYFLNKVCEKILVLESDKVTSYLGNYDYYQEKLREKEEDQEEERPNKTLLNKEKKKEKDFNKKVKKLKNKIVDIERELSKVDQRIKEIEDIFSDNSIYEDKEMILDLTSEMEALNKRQDELLEEWELAEEEYDNFIDS
ncbi:MAG: ABC-F family ATP-binding cassette domain-containing protein [Finegoldia sp.]|nr:ABC-F family ATP-binding cassette domain-containing protein [Finegoldia sp.]